MAKQAVAINLRMLKTL